MDDGLVHRSVGIIFFLLENLDSWVLGVNLAFYEGLQMFWRPDIKTQALADSGDLQADVLLQGAGQLKLAFGAQNAVQRPPASARPPALFCRWCAVSRASANNARAPPRFFYHVHNKQSHKLFILYFIKPFLKAGDVFKILRGSDELFIQPVRRWLWRRV